MSSGGLCFLFLKLFGVLTAFALIDSVIALGRLLDYIESAVGTLESLGNGRHTRLLGSGDTDGAVDTPVLWNLKIVTHLSLDLTLKAVGLVELLVNGLRHSFAFLVVSVGKNDKELVAAVANAVTVVSHNVLEQLGEGNQQNVADIVAECVVVELEVVKVDIQYGSRNLAGALLGGQLVKLLIEILGKALSIEQSGKHIGNGRLFELGVHLLNFQTRLESAGGINQLTEGELEDIQIVHIEKVIVVNEVIVGNDVGNKEMR